MLRILFAFTLVCFFQSISVDAQPAGYKPVVSKNEFITQMKAYSSSLKTIQSQFVQEKHLEYLASALVSKGVFYFKSPNKVRWEYIQPYEYILILNAGKLHMISDGSNNEMDMSGNEIFEQVNNLIIASVSGNIFDNPDYSVRLYEDQDTYLVMLNPSSKYISKLIQEMDLYFDKKTKNVVKIRMNEKGSDYSIINFTNLKINGTIQDAVFAP